MKQRRTCCIWSTSPCFGSPILVASLLIPMDQPARSIRRGLGLDQWSWILKNGYNHWISCQLFFKMFKICSKPVTWQSHMTSAFCGPMGSVAEVSLHMLHLWGFRNLHSLWTGADVHPSAQSAGQCLLELKSMRWDGNNKMICSFFRFYWLYIFLAGIEKRKLYSIYGYFRGLTMAFRGLLPVCV